MGDVDALLCALLLGDDNVTMQIVKHITPVQSSKKDALTNTLMYCKLRYIVPYQMYNKMLETDQCIQDAVSDDAVADARTRLVEFASSLRVRAFIEPAQASRFKSLLLSKLSGVDSQTLVTWSGVGEIHLTVPDDNSGAAFPDPDCSLLVDILKRRDLTESLGFDAFMNTAHQRSLEDVQVLESSLEARRLPQLPPKAGFGNMFSEVSRKARVISGQVMSLFIDPQRTDTQLRS